MWPEYTPYTNYLEAHTYGCLPWSAVGRRDRYKCAPSAWHATAQTGKNATNGTMVCVERPRRARRLPWKALRFRDPSPSGSAVGIVLPILAQSRFND